MARMPRGEPQSVPDPAGELYDREMAKVRAQRRAEDAGFRSPLEFAQAALRDFQDGPDIPRPSTAQSFIPVVGPAWEAVGDLQDENYRSFALNSAMAIADAVGGGVALKGVKAARKGVRILKDGSVTADAARKKLRALGVAKPGQEVHHTVPLKGLGRNVQDWRNHYAMLKVLPKEQHRRLTGSWNGKPRYDPIRRVWYGTTDWMKAAPVGIVGYVGDSIENVSRPHPQYESGPQAKPRR